MSAENWKFYREKDFCQVNGAIVYATKGGAVKTSISQALSEVRTEVSR